MIIYIEKYDKIEGSLLVDFINKETFNLFCKEIHYDNYFKDDRTMLYINNLRFTEGVIPKEGNIYILPNEFYKMFVWIKEPGFNGEIYESEGEFSNIISFRANANYFGKSMFEKALNISRIQITYIKGTWNGNPCGLETLSDTIKIVVKNIGQGNWNEIYSDNKCKAVYDIGAPINASNIQIKNYVNSSNAFNYKPSLIISHWDVDHYQSIFEIDKISLNNICCVFVPNKLISATSKRAYKLLEENCSFIHALSQSHNRATKRRISLELLRKGDHYAFFRGEKSSDINKSGLALEVWTKNGCAILAGDHHYSQIFQDMYKYIPKNLPINIVTPHHGGKAGKIIAPFINSTIAELAVTSTGKNSYGHPFDIVREELSKLGFKWIRTDYEDKDIEIIL